MASAKTLFYLGVCLSAWIITNADEDVPTAENVQWVSMDFKTILKWTGSAPDHIYNVLYSDDDRDWKGVLDCILLTETECDLTNEIEGEDRTYHADIQMEPSTANYDYIPEEPPHTYSSPFNPYRQSNISAVEFTVNAFNDTTVIVNITDALTSIHRHGRQLSIRDILKKDLKYKISYYKSGSTGKRDVISDSSIAEVSKLDPGERYCFMVAAFIPSRPKATQLGTWSTQWCTKGSELSLGAWVGAVFILLTVLIIIITVAVLCCKCCQRNKGLQTTQSSAPI